MTRRDAELDSLNPSPPLPMQRSMVRRAARWVIPVVVLCVVPWGWTLAAGLLAAALWTAYRRARARRSPEAGPAAPSVGRSRGVAGGRSAPGPDLEPGGVIIGTDHRGRWLELDDHQLGAHGLILGASGSGKSTTLLSITGQQIRAGRPMVAIDLKGSPEFATGLRRAAEAAGRPFRVWTLDGPERWNPLGHGNPTELKDRLMSTERFSEPHYKRAAERYVQTALSVMEELAPGTQADLAGVVRMLDPRALREASRRLSPLRAAEVQDYVAGLGRDQISAVRGLQSRLAVLSESHTGAFLAGGPEAIDLRAALDGPEVVLFSLNSSRYGQLAGQLGALVVADLVSAGGAREQASHPPRAATVAIDEFSALGADHVMALIARGRSAGLSVLLATQELADLDRVSHGFRQQVIGSTAVKIAHRQDVSESAAEVARLAGTERVWERSYSAEEGAFGPRNSTRRVNQLLVDRPRVDPSKVQSLRTGEAVVITKVPESRTRLAQVRPLGLGARGGTAGRER